MRYDGARTHTKFWVGQMNSLRDLHNKRRCEPDGRKLFLVACVCFFSSSIYLMTALGLCCGSEWQHNALDDDDVEYKHELTLSLNTATPNGEQQQHKFSVFFSLSHNINRNKIILTSKILVFLFFTFHNLFTCLYPIGSLGNGFSLLSNFPNQNEMEKKFVQ